MTRPDFTCWGERELVEYCEDAHNARERYEWIVSTAYRLLQSDTSDDATNWRHYTERHAPELLVDLSHE